MIYVLAVAGLLAVGGLTGLYWRAKQSMKGWDL